MKFSGIMLLVILPLLSFSIMSCSLFEEDDDDNGGGSTLTISHTGVDWSEGQTENVDWEVSDGETIGWCEPGQRLNEVTGIWYRSFSTKVYRVGNVDLASVASVNTSGWDSDVCDSPLANGDVWVAECQDGYVKFKVINEGSLDSEWWEVEVEYQFSADGNF